MLAPYQFLTVLAITRLSIFVCHQRIHQITLIQRKLSGITRMRMVKPLTLPFAASMTSLSWVSVSVLSKITGVSFVILWKSLDLHAPQLSIRPYQNSPWFGKHIKTLLTKKKCPFKQAEKHNNPDTWSTCHACMVTYKSAVKHAKEKYMVHDLPSLLINNPRKFWKMISHKAYGSIRLTDATGQSDSTFWYRFQVCHITFLCFCPSNSGPSQLCATKATYTDGWHPGLITRHL